MRLLTLPGQPGLQPLSVLGLGTGGFGSSIPEAEAFRLLDAFAEAGGTVLDSAHIYAAWLPDGAGKSETTVGRWLRASGRRAGMVLATKGGHPELATPHISRLAPKDLAQDLRESEQRLGEGVGPIDLYFLHRDDPAIPADEILGALQEPLRAGRIRAIGASNWTPARLREAEAAAARHGYTGFACSQCGWSLAETAPALQGHLGMHYVDRATLAFHREGRFPLLAYGAQAQGFFDQEWNWPWPDASEPTPKRQALLKNYPGEGNLRRWERARDLARRHGHGACANQIALAYVVSQAFPAVALIGPRNGEQLRASLAAVAADRVLTPEEIGFLEQDDLLTVK